MTSPSRRSRPFSRDVMVIRRTLRLTREGWCYLFVLAFVMGGAMLRDINLLLILAGVLLGPLLVSVWMVLRSLRRLEVMRRLPRRVGAGELFVVALAATNRARRGASRMIMVEDTIERVQP